MDRTYIEKHANQLVFFLAIFIATLVTAAAVWRVQTVSAAERQEHLSQEVLRFHVVANSDSKRDQALKIKVRDAVLDWMEEALPQEMDVKQMANYLGLDSILNTSDSAKNAIASALMEQFHSCFNYKISSTSVSGYLAEVDAELTTFDSNSILTQYEKELNTYLASADAVIDGSQKRYNKSHELLLDSIRNNQATITATATFHLTNDGASWKLENAGTELGNAIFGTLTASPVPEDSTEDNE